MSEGMIWGNLLHLSHNMWEDREDPQVEHRSVRDHLLFDKSLWDDLLHRMAAAGMNLLLIDLGDGVRWESHPEIAVRDAWSRDDLKRELAKVRRMGIEPIPKLNFSAAHDTWLKEYSRMVSTRKYYEVCARLIEEAIDLFETPRFFHLGMDEETANHQRRYAYCVVRQHELYWHDFHFLVDQVEKRDVRAWIWSDHVWHHPEAFFQNVPRSVLQSNWYYGESFDVSGADPDDPYRDTEGPRAYLDLEAHGYDQIPTGSNHSNNVNFEKTVTFCRERIAPERLQGFLMAPWRSTLEAHRHHHEAAIEQVAHSKEAFTAS
jgi:hypothetical protein